MGKFHRLNIDEAQSEFPLLNEEARKNLKGGCNMHQFFGGAHSWDDVYKLVDNNVGHQNDRAIWVCDSGLVRIDGNSASVIRDIHEFWVCGIHNNRYLMFSEDCNFCYYDKLSYCNSHAHYFLVYCQDCEKIEGYCDVHQHKFYEYCETCYEKENFMMLYPKGCFEHRNTAECQTCKQIEEQEKADYANRYY